MNIINHIRKHLPFDHKSWGMLLILSLGFFAHAQAQLVIGGNVYGGGDKGNVGGSTSVQVISGDMEGSVFGGARMANVGGSALVNIDGVTPGSSDYTVIDRVYGGNDISGTIGTGATVPELLNQKEHDGIDNTWNAFVHLSDGGNDDQGKPNKKIYIGQLFGGGNGEYDYVSSEPVNGNVTHSIYRIHHTVDDKPIAQMTTPEGEAGFVVPNLKKTYVDIQGGSIVYAYGGGNNATVTENTTIRYDNPSTVVNDIIDTTLIDNDINTTIDPVSGELLTADRFRHQMGINTDLSYPSSDAFQVGRLFGGNNKAEMAIRPLWHLESGKIRNLYSGGNQGMMSSSEGLLLLIDPAVSDALVIDNVYGGCRMADVRPLQFDHNGEHILDENGQVKDMDVIQLTHPVYTFPAGFAARTVIHSGNIRNVYGGNDVTGQVYGGNAVGLYTSIRGDLYGGGNGSYPYTDNPALKDHDIFGDLYFNPDEVLTKFGITGVSDDFKSVTALNAYRPDAEQVSIHLIGTDSDHPTIIGGAVFCGGNSATLESRTITQDPKVELKIGSHVIADSVFMGNNGEHMVDEKTLKYYAGSVDLETGDLASGQDAVDFSDINLTDPDQMAMYMEGSAMNLVPSVSFDNTANGLDRFDYEPYSTYFGSFYWGGNVGSMTYPGTNTMDMYAKVVIYDKLVGGCNNAYVVASDYNAAYDGGILGAPNERDNYTGDRLVMNINGPKIEPKRWNENKTQLLWNTFKWDDTTDDGFLPIGTDNTEDDIDRRILGGNIYGGCYSSGHVNGNIVINIEGDLIVRDEVFAQNGNRNSGVILDEQSSDVNTVAMTVFGAGKGRNTEVWGSTTINHRSGYAFQIFGGGEEGVVGKGTNSLDDNDQIITDEDGYPVREYAFNPAYSTTVNLSGSTPYLPGDEEMPQDLPQSEYLYAAGNEGDVCGNSYMYLGNGHIYDAFGGASNANILGYAQSYIGRQINKDGTYVSGFPRVTDIVYGGNDFGGRIEGGGNLSTEFYTSRVRDYEHDKEMIYDYDAQNPQKVPFVLKAAAYVEYLQGTVDTIFGGSYGNYDYDDPEFYVDDHKVDMPYVHSSFVNFRPDDVTYNSVNAVFGGNTGYPGNRDGDKSLDHSYVLVDIPYATVSNYRNTEFFGSGSYSGLGMRERVLPKAEPGEDATQEQLTEYNEYLEEANEASAIIDLIRGKVGAAYGGSFKEGITRRTVVNVPAGSTIDIGSIFGGAYGNSILAPCDVYEANVNYHSADAVLTSSPYRWDSQTGKYIGNNILKGAIYGGNNTDRRTLYSKINIDVPVRQDHWNYGMTTATVYGAGRGNETWSEYTQVNLLPGAEVYEVYGGGEDGIVINSQSIQKYINEYATIQGLGNGVFEKDLEKWKASWTIGSGYDTGFEDELDQFTSFSGNNSTFYLNNPYTNLENPLVRKATEYNGGTFNTNVIIHQGATVNGYAYGGGLGHNSLPQSGNIYGTTYIALLGGTVSKDLYAAGTTGAVFDAFGVGRGSDGFVAEANAYIEGGTARNVYGGGWEGNVGYHPGTAQDPNSTANDNPGRTNVVIGIRPELAQGTYYKGDPAIQRNAYAGGEGGAVIGQANITVNNGHIGYIYLQEGQAIGENAKVISSPGAPAQYVEHVDDETYYDNNNRTIWLGQNRLEDYGNVFGSGFDDLSSVDESNVSIYGGIIRNSVFGGGEIATVGRGSSAGELGQVNIYKAGKTHIYMYNGKVTRNVFGGGKGYNKLGYGNSHKLYTQGYVFGQTDVNIYGGEIGTLEGIAQGYGNVFGGGDQGFVFSAFEYPNGSLGLGKKSGTRYDDADEGYYYMSLNGTFTDNNGYNISQNAEKYMTEDCHVLIEPWLQIKPDAESITVGSKTYYAGDYVPTSYLNTLPKKESSWSGDWAKLDAGDNERGERGVIIHNAVFAGGNVSSGSDINANIKTVYGNATASINDVYHRDLVTIGTGRIGGLYGDGNLTFVDGYRELNITNYGTDFYHITPDIDITTYESLPDREKAYYELKFKCVQECYDIEGTKYSVGSSIPQDQLIALFTGKEGILNADGTPNEAYWVKNGILLRAPGRTMNTLQRADFCGVFGSRLVMQGARDRVPEVVDYTNYTINRVREVSLNKRASNAGDTDDKDKEHGNYFGIYSVVNYLGALTSDVDFGDGGVGDGHGDIRETSNQDASTYKSDIVIGSNTYHYLDPGATYYNWKKQHINDRTRNNGKSHNQVALASGVYLELTNEKVLSEEEATGIDLYDKDWGIITGVVELDLINVSTGLGGGFVYAKNVHGTRTNTGKRQTTLSALNEGAATKKKYTYSTSGSTDYWQSSGNFVHSTQTIIDDCYNMSGRFYDDPSNEIAAVPAHYWFIKGQIYVYDQVISAYTGAPNAYSETVNIPLTISAGANGRMRLVDVQPNLYAYYQTYNDQVQTPLTQTTKLVLNDVTYNLNDPISYWDWQKLSKAEQKLFVPETYVVIEDCQIGETPYTQGTVLLESEYNALFVNDQKPTNVTQKRMVGGVETDVPVDFDFVFRSSNNLSHNTGYLLTYNVDNPNVWDKWYTPITGSATDKVDSESFKTKDQSLYNDGPTYHPTQAGLYGQYQFGPADIISKDIYDKYNTAWGKYILSADWTGMSATEQEEKQATQATFERAYLTNAVVDATKLTDDGNVSIRLQKGAALAKSEYCENIAGSWPAELQGKVDEAYVCTSTIKISDTEYITTGDLMTLEKKQSYINRLQQQIDALPQGDPGKSSLESIKKEINNFIVEAYYCTSQTDKLYGGDYYETGKNYRALNAWSSMSQSDRANFEFNYDALDLLIDPTYSMSQSHKYQYDSKAATADAALLNPAGYSLSTALDYTAQYNGSDPLEYKTDANTDSTAYQGVTLTRTEFERLPNEQNNYAPIQVGKEGTYYIVNTEFTRDEPYAVGQLISKETYDALHTEDKDYITSIEFETSDVGKTLYYCRNEYTIDSDENIGKPVMAIMDGANYSEGEIIERGDTVPVGFIISQDGSGVEQNYAYGYRSLINKQKSFSIHGKAPVETSTLYVSRYSDIFDLSQEKIITVVYQYDYEESDESGNNITPVSERHVVNIHLQFKSGIPTIDNITSPDIVLPGTSVSLRTPEIAPGAYEIIDRGWELFERESFAESHVNGAEYTPNSDPLYWYQDGYYVAYYAKTYLGKTYSNYVPVTVANYHDLLSVMSDKENHMFVDYDRTKLKRNSKIYINDYTSAGQNGIDLLKDLFDLSLLNDESAGVTAGVVSEAGNLYGHSLLNTSTETGHDLSGKSVVSGVKGATNLDFILRTNIDHTGSEWTPIGDASNCFNGTLHGDGYTISGLSNSLFAHLCGDVYNLGVTGTFTGAGIAESGDGYVENSWISTTSTEPKTSQPILGSSNRADSDPRGPVQIVNSYYMEEDDAENGYINYADNSTTGTPIRKTSQEFHNGQVAFHLNGFYLNRRYYNGTNQSSGAEYRYIDANNGNKLDTIYYPTDALAKFGDLGYVEDRYADGDYRFAAGSTDTGNDIRQVYENEDNTNSIFVPVWPDDYIFFGQNLTYGYDDNKPHQSAPAHYYTTAATSNRVYRAPAYFGNSIMDLAYFNPDAILPATAYGDDSKPAYQGLTAIDFTGYNDSNYGQGLSSNNRFYTPLLDFDGLRSIRTDGLTQNLLAYSKSGDNATNTVLNSYFVEPEYAQYANVLDANDQPTDNVNEYESIRKVEETTVAKVRGHVVLKQTDGTYQAAMDQFLVDKQDFNAPISYIMGSRTQGNYEYDNVMWYQRTPQVFVRNAGNGWESVSLPFTAKRVTTSQKGWITHFYEGSNIGHEYWLRTPDKMDETDETGKKVLFKSLAKASASDISDGTGADVTYNNRFLYDYYYSKNLGSDANSDTYHQEFYNSDVTYRNYPFAAAAQPYLIGFPSERYYEFDMSGNFDAQNTASTKPGMLDRQTITFVSDWNNPNVTINVSDNDYLNEATVSGASYRYKPTYQALELAGQSTFLMNDEGTAFLNDNDTSTVKTVPFRAYFTAPSGSGAQTRSANRAVAANALFIGYSGNQDDLEDVASHGGLNIYSEDMSIYVESTLEYETRVTITTVAGKQLKQFTIQPGAKVQVPVNSRGVYIVNHKKIAVTK